ncbi:MAG: hypothetical protein CK426_03835 [Legionella sp.]|nr:MAG: hypothetical protein CK423_09535 [Legionella sp.]PJD99052.1 MAG: hypothetical protein CK426_03835 [Legionella sp.]
MLRHDTIKHAYFSLHYSIKLITRQLLVLAYLAIHDESKPQGTREDAQALFIDGLYKNPKGL